MVEVLKKAVIVDTDFSGRDLRGADMSLAHFTRCSFVGSDLGDANAIGARFDHCDFVGSHLQRTNFTRAVFLACSFSYADLRASVLTETHFRDSDMMGANLFDAVTWHADLTGVKYLRKRSFRDPETPHQTRLSETNPTVSHECYRTLKHYLYRSGQHDDASWAAYRERLMERKHFFQNRDLRYFPSLLMDLLSGYTEKPQRVVMSSLVIVLLFAALYHAFNAIVGVSGAAPGIFNCLYFSFVTFTTVGYGDIVPRADFLSKALACAEAFAGPFMAGLFVFTLTRRYAAS